MVDKKTNVGFKSKFGAMVAIGLTLVLGPATAHAKISDWFGNAGEEVVAIANVLVLIFGAAGVVLTGIGVIGAIFAKKNKQPMEHQPWFIIGGVLCILLVPLTMALSESIAGDDQGMNTQDFLNSKGEF